MATAKANRKAASAAVDLPECPVCMETMTAPIFQCQSGHSLCSGCTAVLCPSICPICRQPMTQMRNWQLEDIVAKAKVPCPNKSVGCVYTMPSIEVEDHIKECIFREMDCPLGAVFGRCSWSGRLKEMMEHFKERHPTNCNVSSDTDIELKNVDVNIDDRFVYLYAQGKMIFIITMKIDTLQTMAYWNVQHIGSKSAARQHIYEIHVTSKQDPRRKAIFMEHCFNDAIKADEIFRQYKCGIMPLNVLKHFVSGKSLSFRFFVKRCPPISKVDDQNKDAGKKGPGPKNPSNNNAGQNKGPHNKPKGPGPKVPGPQGQSKASKFKPQP